MGWDDNGLPTERRVQNYYGVRCDPTLPYDPDFTPPAKPARRTRCPISRRNFIELCRGSPTRTRWPSRSCGAGSGCRSTGRTSTATIVETLPRDASAMFLRNLARGEAYRPRRRRSGTSRSAPPSRRPSSRTGSARAPTTGSRSTGPDRARSSSRRPGPSCCPACVALVAHPDDERYQPLFGTTVRTPVFGVEVPVVAHPLAEPEKGSGIAMICTFGDLTDVIWWRELQLPTRAVIGRDGRLLRRPAARRPRPQPYDEMAGKTIVQRAAAHGRAAARVRRPRRRAASRSPTR